MPPTAQTPGYMGILLFGSTQIPVMPGARLSCPKNFIVPPIIGNYWQVNYAEGFRQPVLDVNLLVRDKVGEAFGSAFLNLFLSRLSDASNDTNVILGGVTIWDGRTGFTLTGAKADSFTLGTSKGELVRFSARFCGSGITSINSAPTFTQWDTTPPVTFAGCNFTGGLASKVWNFNLSYSNNHNPDMSLNGTTFPAAMNAGLPTAGLNLLVQGADTVPSDNTAINITIAGGGSRLATFTLNNPADQTPDDRSIDMPRIMRQHNYLCQGADGQTTPPLTVTTNF